MKRIQLENRTELWNEIPLDTPYVLWVDPSSKCNLKCEFCMNQKIQHRKSIDFNLYTEIIDETHFFNKPIKTLRLYGFGEPFMNRMFSEMVKYARKYGNVDKIDTTSNGLLITKEVADKTIAAGIDRINISVNHIVPELIENIRYLYSIAGDKTTIFVKTIGDNLSEDKKNFFMDTFTPISHGCDIEHLMQCWYDTNIDMPEQKVGIYGQPLQNVDICPYVFYQMFIDSHGRCLLCFLDWDSRVILGDCYQISLTSLWKRYKPYQIDMLRGMKQTMCNGCNQLKAGFPVDLDTYRNEIMERLI